VAAPMEEPEVPFEEWSLLQLREGVRQRGGVAKGTPPPHPTHRVCLW